MRTLKDESLRKAEWEHYERQVAAWDVGGARDWPPLVGPGLFFAGLVMVAASVVGWVACVIERYG